MTWAVSWVITDLRLRPLLPRGCRALSARADRLTRSRVYYLANWRRISNGLAKVSGPACYVTHSRDQWRERAWWAGALYLSTRWTKKRPRSGDIMGLFLH